MPKERVARLRAEVNDLHARASELTYNATAPNRAGLSEQERAELADIRARIPVLEAALLEAEDVALTGDGTARP